MNRTHVLLPLAVLGALSACGGDDAGHADTAVVHPPVDVTVVAVTGAPDETMHPARVVAGRQVEVSTRMAGALTWVAPLGTRVGAGDVLARLDDSDVRAGLEQAEAGAELARRTADRIRNLAAAGAASQQELDQAVAAERAAIGAVDAARAQLAYVELVAPVAGEVTARMMETGDLATPGRPVVRLASRDRELHAELPAELRGSIEAGTSIRLEDGMPLEVLRVSPALDAATRRFTVELSAPATARAGEVVRIVIGTGTGISHPHVPASAVVHRGQLTGVFTLESDTLRLRWLRLGRETEGRYEILGGPSGISEVVLNPPVDLHDGTPAGRVTRAAAEVEG